MRISIEMAAFSIENNTKKAAISIEIRRKRWKKREIMWSDEFSIDFVLIFYWFSIEHSEIMLN